MNYDRNTYYILIIREGEVCVHGCSHYTNGVRRSVWIHTGTYRTTARYEHGACIRTIYVHMIIRMYSNLSPYAAGYQL